MKEKIMVSIVVLIIMSGIIIIPFLISKSRMKRQMEDVRKQYPQVKIDESFSGVVSSVEHPYSYYFRDNPHQAYLLFDGSIRRRVSASYELDYKVTLDSILRVGDLLFKQNGSDTLYIYRIQHTDTLKFSFELRDDLGYKLKEKLNKMDAH